MGAEMSIQEIVGFLVAVSLPLWLGIEELVHRYAPRRDEHLRVAVPAMRVPRSVPSPSPLRQASGL